MFGIGPQELLVIGLLALIVFGPMKAAGMARDLGRLVDGANRAVEEFKGEFISEELLEVRRAVEGLEAEVVPDEIPGRARNRPTADGHGETEATEGATTTPGALRPPRRVSPKA